jgi:hypothetical protein
LEGAISGNQIGAVGVNSLNLPKESVIAGIRVDGCVDVRISDNTITAIAPASFFSYQASGILINKPLVDIEIADNTIRRQVETNDSDTSDWEAIRILGTSNPPAPPPPQNKKSRSVSEVNFPQIDNLSTSGIVAAVGSFAAAVSPGSEQVGIISNSLHGYGGRALVEVQVSDSCRFGDNYCLCTLGDNAFAAIKLSAASLIVSANRVECNAKIIALDLTVSDVGVGDGNPPPAGVVLGNIVGGSIRLNAAELDATWKPLNMKVT